jgi:hypothetical protein
MKVRQRCRELHRNTGRPAKEVKRQPHGRFLSYAGKIGQGHDQSFQCWRDNLHRKGAWKLKHIGKTGDIHTSGQLSHRLSTELSGPAQTIVSGCDDQVLEHSGIV